MRSFFGTVAVWMATLYSTAGVSTADQPPIAPAYCPGEYADDHSSLVPQAREREQAMPSYTFCVRTAATYECPSYGPDGNLRRTKRRKVAHGTGFAYRLQNGETLVVTNQHVADWPAVTDEDHPVEDVPPGCKRVSDSLKIVDNDRDSYERDDITLGRVVVDPQLDLAILKAKAELPVLPWKLGHSAGLRARNIVDVRGFPLGYFRATNVGKVVSAFDHDTYKDWDHDDFVIDAMLSSGNSGSPVFAISCKTGEFELVGIYHAAYTLGSALNVVVGIDQVRDLLTTLKRPARPRMEAGVVSDKAARSRLLTSSQTTLEPYFPFGSLVAAVRARSDETLFFEVLNRDFPLHTFPLLVLEDRPSAATEEFGRPGRVWIGNRQGLVEVTRSELDADAQAQLAKALDGLRLSGLAAFALREADVSAATSRERFDRRAKLEKSLQRTTSRYADLAQTIVDLAERMGPQPGSRTADLKAALADPTALVSTAPTVAPSPPSPPITP